MYSIVHRALQAVGPQPSTVPCHGPSQLYLADLSCIWLIWNEELMHYDTKVVATLRPH